MTDTLITTPGKFEGERPILIAAYNRWLAGFADDDGEIITVDLPTETVRFTIDSFGFVSEVTP
jgi:hypothetical protein